MAKTGRWLISHEASGVTRRAFRALGIEAWSCDLLPSDDGSEFHIQGNALDVYRDGWDGMIAHPDCTYLCASGLHWNRRGMMVDGRPRSELTEEALEHVRQVMAAPIPRIIIENSRGCISTRIRPYDQTIHPYQFGHDASKRTDLWLKGVPKMVIDPAQFVPPRMVRGKPRWGNQSDSGQNNVPEKAGRWRLRAQTYEGIAKAWALQYGRLPV